MKLQGSINVIDFVFLSHLSGDEGYRFGQSYNDLFLSHLSGDEVLTGRDHQIS